MQLWVPTSSLIFAPNYSLRAKGTLISEPRFSTPLHQKTREGCGCFRGLFGGSQGKLRESPGKLAEKKNPEAPNATNSGILGTGKRKPAGNLGSTLPGPCPHLPCGVLCNRRRVKSPITNRLCSANAANSRNKSYTNTRQSCNSNRNATNAGPMRTNFCVLGEMCPPTNALEGH